MKKIIIFVLILLVFILGFYKIFYKNNNPPVGGLSNRPINRDEIVKKDDFEILIPSGWQEINPMAEGVLMSGWDKEVSADENAKKINYHANFNVTFGSLEKQTIEKYLQLIKEQLKKIAPDVKYINETNTSLEVELSQQGVDFKARVDLVMGSIGNVWTISFNTPKSEWGKYKPIFDEILKSFVAK